MRKLLAVILLPLSLIPVALAVPHISEQRESFRARYVERERFPAPDIKSVPRAQAPARPDRIPVLIYHGITDVPGKWNLTREAFAKQMDALDQAGYETVSAADYARHVRGERVELPENPILITFDDGRLDSFRGADAILERYGFRATMFAITGAAVEYSRNYLGPEELADMDASGRWDVQLHAGRGHQRIDSDTGGKRGFYATRAPGESLAEYRTRVEEDVDGGFARLKEIVPGVKPDLFAVPYSDYGQAPGGDPQVARTMRAVMTERFDAVFIQQSAVRPARRGQTGLQARYEPVAKASPEALLRALRDGIRPTKKGA